MPSYARQLPPAQRWEVVGVRPRAPAPRRGADGRAAGAGAHGSRTAARGRRTMTDRERLERLEAPDWAGPRPRLWAIVVGAGGTIAWIVAASLNPAQAYYSYLTAYAYAVGIALGALALIMIEHLVGGTWFIVMRRTAEDAGRRPAGAGGPVPADRRRRALALSLDRPPGDGAARAGARGAEDGVPEPAVLLRPRRGLLRELDRHGRRCCGAGRCGRMPIPGGAWDAPQQVLSAPGRDRASPSR